MIRICRLFALVFLPAIFLAGPFAKSTAASVVQPKLDSLAGKHSPLREGDRIAFLGDSITELGAGKNGYLWLIEQALAEGQRGKKIELIKAGISGNKVPDLQKRLDADVLSKKPTIVFVYIGINDVWHWSLSGQGTTQEDFYTGLSDVVRRIQDTGAIVVLATPSVIGEKRGGANKHDANLDIYADISRRIAREKKLVLCDLRKAFAKYLKKNNPQDLKSGVLTIDGVHLNDRGNQLVANCAAASLAKALKKRKS